MLVRLFVLVRLLCVPVWGVGVETAAERGGLWWHCCTERLRERRRPCVDAVSLAVVAVVARVQAGSREAEGQCCLAAVAERRNWAGGAHT